MAYRKYDQKTMFLISKSKNPYLFPQLNIPRTTAMYWIKNEIHLKKPLKPKDCRVTEVEILRSKLSKAQEEVRKLKAQNKCLRSYIKILNQKSLIKPIKDPLTQKLFTLMINRYRKHNSVRSICEKLEISFSKYKRWSKNSISKSENSKSPRSLSYNEISKIKEYYTSKEYFFYPIHALSTKAKINQDVYACPKTWSGYAKKFNLKRPLMLKKKVVKYPVGIQASSPNAIWHIDITEIRINYNRFYIQAIKDNYSRAILGISFNTKISGLKTKNLIQESIHQYGTPEKIMSDAGKENLNYVVRLFLEENDIKHLVAKKNTRYSNSRVETFFRMLKSNYLNKFKLKNLNELINHIQFYKDQYNLEIPHSALDFRTPMEVFNGLSEVHYKELFSKYRITVLQKRVS